MKKFRKIVIGAFVICGLLLPSVPAVVFAEGGKMDTAADIMTLCEKGVAVLLKAGGAVCLFALPFLLRHPLYGKAATKAWVQSD